MELEPKESILVGPTTTLASIPLHKAFDEMARSTFAEKPALIHFSRTYSYNQLSLFSNQIAKLILKIINSKRLSKNSDGDYVIAVSMNPTDHMVAALLAIWKTGAAYLPLDPSFPKNRVEHILQEAKPTLVICDNDDGNFQNTFAVSFASILKDCDELPSTPLEKNDVLEKSTDDVAIILYTSGSTGVPKGVRITHSNIRNRLEWQFRTFPYSETETTCVFKTALTFVDSVCEIWGPLLKGLALLVIPKIFVTNPEKLVAELEKYKVERLFLVPSLLSLLLTYFQYYGIKNCLPHLKTWICSGETLLKSLVVEFYSVFPSNKYRLCNFYGSTEIMGDVTYYVITNLEQLDKLDKIPIGKPIDNTIAYIMDSNLHPVKVGSVGELFVSGLNLAAGYVNGRDPERFIDNPLSSDPRYNKLYKTGDFARVENQCLIYEGRTDSQIKIRGHRVDISEVEKAVNTEEGIDKAVVLCYKVDEAGQTLLAFVTTTKSMSEQQIQDSLKEKLIGYMIPQIVLVDTIPLLVNGKVDRKLLLHNYERFDVSNKGHKATVFDYTDVTDDYAARAKLLFETVASVLNYPRTTISTSTNFYDIGGTSLNSISTITALKEKGCHISIEDFLSAKTLGELIFTIKPDAAKNCKLVPCEYTAEALVDSDREDVVDMIVTSLCQRSEWKQWMDVESCRAQFELIWKGLSPTNNLELGFIVKSREGRPIGATINIDARNEPEPEVLPSIQPIFDFLDECEKPILEEHLPQDEGKILHCMVMGTHSSLSAKENVAVIRFMEEKVLEQAKAQNFEYVLTTNVSPLTQQLCTDVLLYETYSEHQVNAYIASDGTKPFSEAPNDWSVLVQIKMIESHSPPTSCLNGSLHSVNPLPLQEVSLTTATSNVKLKEDYEGGTELVVTVKGRVFSLTKLENALLEIDGVENAVVLCYRAGEPNQSVLAFIKCKKPLTELQIETLLKTALPSYMIPKLILMDLMPLLENGTIDRQLLLKQYSERNASQDDGNQHDSRIDYTGILNCQMKAATALFETVASVINVKSRCFTSRESNFYEIGGNSLNSILAISALRQKGYPIEIGDFIAASNLGEILHTILSNKQKPSTIATRFPSYTIDILENKHRDDVINMIAKSFNEKAELECWIPGICEGDYREFIGKIWQSIVAAGLSCVLIDERGNVVGVAINFDAHNEPSFEVSSRLKLVLEFLYSVEASVHDSLPTGKGKVLHNLMITTHPSLTSQENILIIKRLEEEVIQIGKSYKFEGVLTTNSNPLTQQLANDIFSYQTLLEYQVNLFVASDGTKPFNKATDSQKVLVQWKPLNS